MELEKINHEVSKLNSSRDESISLAKTLFENIAELVNNKFFNITIKLFEGLAFFVYYFKESYLSLLKLELYQSIKNKDTEQISGLVDKIKIIYANLGLDFIEFQDYLNTYLIESSIFSSAFYKDIKEPTAIKSILNLIFQEFNGFLVEGSLINCISKIDKEIFLLIIQYLQYKSINNVKIAFDDYLLETTATTENNPQHPISFQVIKVAKSNTEVINTKHIFQITKIHRILQCELDNAIKNKEIKKIKNMKVSSVKCFEYKILKRENIDKTIIRKFFKHHKKTYFSYPKTGFFYEFMKNKLVPPFEYQSVVFKTINTSYMVWLFSHAEIREEYYKINHLLIDKVLDTISTAEEYKNDREILKIYVDKLPQVYSEDKS